MPLYLDIHTLDGVTSDQVAQAHLADLTIQGKHSVNYHRYWFNESRSKVFCLCSAPDRESARRVHEESHGLVAEKIIEVHPDLIDEFLGGGEEAANGAVLLSGGLAFDTGQRTVLFTDIVGSTGMTQQLGDAGAMLLVDEHDAIVRFAVREAGGREVKHTGDGIMAAFVFPAAAVRCAVKVQQALALRNGATPHLPLQVRIGAATGEPVERNNDFFGTTVQLAARLCAHAQPEEILVAADIGLDAAADGVPFEDLADVSLKGFEQPQRVMRVRWRDESLNGS